MSAFQPINPIALLRLGAQARARREARNDQAFQNAIGLIQATGGELDPKKMVGALPEGFPADKVQALEEITKLVRKRSKESELAPRAQGASQALAGALLSRDPQRITQASQVFPELSRAGADLTGSRAATVEALEAGREQRRQERLSLQQSLPSGIRTLDVATREGAIGPERRQESLRRLLEREESGTRTPFERILREVEQSGLIEPEEAAIFRMGRLAAINRGRDGIRFEQNPDGGFSLSIGGSPEFRQIQKSNELLTQVQDIDLVIDGLEEMRALIREDPGRAGLSASIRNLVGTGVGIGEAIFEVTGSDALLNFGRDTVESVLQQGDERAERFREEFGDDLVDALVDPEIATLETKRLLNAFALANINQGGSGRLTVRAVRDFFDKLNFKDVRGARFFEKTLDGLVKNAKKRRRNLIQRAERFELELPSRQPAIRVPTAPARPSLSPGSSAPVPSRRNLPRFRIEGGQLVPAEESP